MGKKLLFYFSLFLIVLGINFLLITKLQKQNSRLRYAKRILDDIDTSIARISSGQDASENKVVLADSRVANLKIFFRKYNSPLYDHAATIVEVSDKYHFDYRLLPAIAMQESNVCRYIPENSHNCWGWGIYGDLVTRFDSYDEAIQIVAKGIKENYIDHGLITASAIMQKYTPSSPGTWARGVNVFLEMLQ